MNSGEANVLHRAAVLGDVHGEDHSLEAALNWLEKRGPWDVLLCTGDLLDGHQGTDADRCCQLIREHNVQTVRGNHDRWFFERADMRARLGFGGLHTLSDVSREFLAALPATRHFATSRGNLLLCHGIGENDTVGINAAEYESDAEVTAKLANVCPVCQLSTVSTDTSSPEFSYLLGGHTHVRLVRQVAGITVLNAGTLQWGYSPCFLTLDFDAGQAQFFDIAPDTCTITAAEEYAL